MFDNEDEYSKFVEHCQDIGKVAGLLDQLRGWTVYRTPYPTLKRLVHAAACASRLDTGCGTRSPSTINYLYGSQAGTRTCASPSEGGLNASRTVSISPLAHF